MSLTSPVLVNDVAPPTVAAAREPPPEARLAARLPIALAESSVHYCQWKGAWKHDRWSVGEGDIDLLVDRADRARFDHTLAQLGFRAVQADPSFALPGVTSWLAPDRESERMLHVHAHFQLYVGRPWSTHFRLPIERAVLRTAATGAWFDVPAVEFELLLLVLHGTLRYSAREIASGGDAKWLGALREQMERLGGDADPYVLVDLMAEHLPEVDPACFDRCRAALGPESGPWRRLAVRQELAWRLRAYARRPARGAWTHRVRHALASIAGKRALPQGKKRLMTGGAVIALAGTDGAGKSTCARALTTWLGTELRVLHAHLGRPARGALTLLAGGALRVSRWIDARRRLTMPSVLTTHLELVRCLGTARDRYALHERVWRFAGDGGLAICERYPLAEEHVLVGPSAVQGIATAATGWLAARLRRREARYYARLAAPDLVIVLRVTPAIAVRRKVDEPAAYVHERAHRVARIDWQQRGARIIDADQPLADVVRDVRRCVWEAL